MEEIKKLYRFTTLPFLLNLLYTKKLTLLDPTLWEDNNDRATLEAYREKSNLSSLYVLCLTLKDSIHHWNAFANGTSGCCIKFNPDRLFAILDNNNVIKRGPAKYISVGDLSGHAHTTEQLPYVKRKIFKAEAEYRIIGFPGEPQKPAWNIDIDLRVISKITFSYKLPASTFENIRDIFGRIDKSLKLIRMRRATTYSNQTWINHFST